jgi:hypothetical protein
MEDAEDLDMLWKGNYDEYISNLMTQKFSGEQKELEAEFEQMKSTFQKQDDAVIN